MLRPWGSIGLLLPLACGPTVSVTSDDAGGGSASTTAATTPTTADSMDATGVPPTPTTSTSGTTGTADDSEGEAEDEGPFGFDCAAPPGPWHHCIGPAADSPPPFDECSLWKQDCPRGQKCNPRARFGTVWEGSICVDVQPSAVEVGGPCNVNLDSGDDDCGFGLWCVPHGFESPEGTCWELCTPSRERPSGCSQGACVQLFDDWVPTCVESCDPMLQDCAQGRCDAVSDTFHCVPPVLPEASPPGECIIEGQCETGSTCLGGGFAPDCGGAACCTHFCDALAPDPVAACPGGGTCNSWYDAGMAPVGLEHVGVCVQ